MPNKVDYIEISQQIQFLVGEEGIEPSASRTRTERSTDDLLPDDYLPDDHRGVRTLSACGRNYATYRIYLILTQHDPNLI